MTKISCRAIIKLLTKGGENTNKGGVGVLGDNARKCYAVTRLTEEFQLEQGALEDHPWCGRSMEITTFDIFDLIQNMVIDDLLMQDS